MGAFPRICPTIAVVAAQGPCGGLRSGKGQGVTAASRVTTSMSKIIKGENLRKPHTVRYRGDGRQRERSFATAREARDFQIKMVKRR